MCGHLIVLSAFWQNVFYINHPFYVQDVFGVFDITGQKNDTLPDDWQRLVSSTINNTTSVFKIDLKHLMTSKNNNSNLCCCDSIHHKLRLFLANRTHIDQPWESIALINKNTLPVKKYVNYIDPIFITLLIVQFCVIIECIIYIRFLKCNYIGLKKLNYNQLKNVIY